MNPPLRAADSLLLCSISRFKKNLHQIFLKASCAVGLVDFGLKSLMSKIWICILSSGLLCACQAKRESKLPTVTAAAVTTTKYQKKPERVVVKSKTRASEATLAVLDSKIPAKTQTFSDQIGAKLQASFEVVSLHKDTLQVSKSSAQKSSASLFEEAIIVGKLRSFLKSSATAKTHQSVGFHAGVATVNFLETVNPGSVSVLIAKMLSLDGVNEVRAVFAE